MLERITTPNIRGEGLGQPAAKCGLPGRAKGMKNTMNITLGNINLVIEGQPVVLENINLEYTNECSVQELAASASFIKDMVSEVKNVIKEAQACASAPAVQYKQQVAKEVLPAGTFDDRAVLSKQEKSTKKVSQKWDLSAVWEVLMSTLPDGFDKTGVGSFVYTHERENEKGNTVRTTIKLMFNDTIDMRIYVGESSASFYLYEDAAKSWVDGINKTLVEDLIDELPSNVREFVRSFVKKVLTK